MLRTAVGLSLAAMIAAAGTAQARVTIIYPPHSYQAPYKFCPLYWDELYTTDCYCPRGHDRHGYDRHDAPELAPVNLTQVNVQVIRSRRAKTIVIVVPGRY